MGPLHEVALSYLATLQVRGLNLELVEGCRLRIPAGHTPAEVELVRMLKQELLEILEQDAEDLRQERAAIFEYDAGIIREQAEGRAGLPGQSERKAS
jgi:hypothetical protein